MNETATKDSWKTQAIDNPKRIAIDLHFTGRQFLKLSKGLVPQPMEDKWFVYYENEWLYFHRSRTGYGIYKAKLNKETDGYSITEFWTERNHEKYKNNDDDTDVGIFKFLIAGALLGSDVHNIRSKRSVKTGSDEVKDWDSHGNMVSAPRRY